MADFTRVGQVMLCVHCSTETNGKYCPLCRTAEDRRKMDEENDKIFMENFGKHYICKVCLKENGQKNKQN
jgi:hypothetical protein